MNWLVKFFKSSIGQKLIMSLTGLFLCSFLLVHCAGNTLLFKGDGGMSFNYYGEFMSKNPVIKTIAYGLYAMILVHAFKGLTLAWANRKARGEVSYAVANGKSAVPFSKQMAILGSIIFIFIGIHMSHFWYSVQIGAVPHVEYTFDGQTESVENLYASVAEAFKKEWIVALYVLSCVALAFHLIHGFQSAFQTLGLNHKKYTPIIKGIGYVFSIVVCLAFAAMPIFFYLK